MVLLKKSPSALFAVTALMFLARSTRAFLRPSLPSRLLSTRHFFSTPSPLDIGSPEEVLQVFNKPNAVILDVRSQPEIDSDGKIATSGDDKWLQVNCTPAACPDLEDTANEAFPNKDTPVVIHCASGMRAGKAKEILEELGYSNVINAGGYRDLDYLQEAASQK
ncbi:Rhodanese-like protein [Seminavis robusta]|uniref:Rhodanese-like protein n=1 Tax=Seminavis robusta TaxID=568900 RepID=A0A9N8E658_9STRA|nr:Rhodanese-like protein [Seminavis robusta]|eukprot:Sro590_g171870.1 Rhodanese-like protein (164) ;mRNA; f:36514-37080